MRYRELKNDLNASLKCFEVCALGNIPKHARETVRYLVGRRAARETFKTLAKIAISASYYVFNRLVTRNGSLHPCLRGMLWILVRSSSYSACIGLNLACGLWLSCSGSSNLFSRF